LEQAFEPLGSRRLKNIAAPVRIYRLQSGRPRPRIRISRRWWTLGVPAAIAVALAAWLALYHLPTIISPPASGSIPSVAVLPFKDLSADKSLGYLGEGVANDIIATLSRFADVAVVSRTSSFAYKDKEGDVRQIGKDLGVGYLLEGSVRKEGDRVRIIAQLINVNSGDHVWADRFDKAGTDPWALQDEITGKIVGR
jgi:TolB-like protein